MKSFLISSLVLFILDIVWILLFMQSKYTIQVEEIQKSPMKVNMVAMVLAYSLMIVGLCVFVIPHILVTKSVAKCIVHAGLFGLIVYGIFDFTNMAVFAKWNKNLAIIDIMWGGFVYILAGLSALFVDKENINEYMSYETNQI